MLGQLDCISLYASFQEPKSTEATWSSSVIHASLCTPIGTFSDTKAVGGAAGLAAQFAGILQVSQVLTHQ